MMNDERITELLQQVDAAAGSPVPTGITAAGIRRRIRHRRCAAGGVFAVTAGGLLIASLWWIHGCNMDAKQQRITSLEEQVRQLKTQTEETLALVRDVLANERQQDRLAALQAELASIPDPVEQMKQRDEKTAFTLVYQADRMYREMNQVESAVATYEQVIRLYPQDHWADVARQRITEIKNPRTNDKSGTQGETKWQRQSETPLV
jgi:hypothetical protein